MMSYNHRLLGSTGGHCLILEANDIREFEVVTETFVHNICTCSRELGASITEGWQDIAEYILEFGLDKMQLHVWTLLSQILSVVWRVDFDNGTHQSPYRTGVLFLPLKWHVIVGRKIRKWFPKRAILACKHIYLVIVELLLVPVACIMLYPSHFDLVNKLDLRFLL